MRTSSAPILLILLNLASIQAVFHQKASKKLNVLNILTLFHRAAARRIGASCKTAADHSAMATAARLAHNTASRAQVAARSSLRMFQP